MKQEKVQIAVRLTELELKQVKQYLLDRGMTFQGLIKEYLNREVIKSLQSNCERGIDG